MFRFGEPIFLYLLIIVPVLIGLFLYANYRRRKKIRIYAMGSYCWICLHSKNIDQHN